MQKIPIFRLLVGCSVLLLALMFGCGGKYDVYKESRIALGTVVEITVAHENEAAARKAIAAAFAEFERIENLLSTYRPDSEIGALNNSGGKMVSLSGETAALLRLARELGEVSHGAFDVTIGPVMDLWRFDEGGRIPDDAELADAAARVDYRFLEVAEEGATARLLRPGMKVDLGAVGKGYAVDRAAEVLLSSGVSSAIIDAGGDLRLLGGKPGKGTWRIGILHPRRPGKLLLSLDLAETSVVTSGDYERFFAADGERYHHLLDPATGRPARGCQSVTVIAPSAAMADALATAAFIKGAEEGIDFLRRLEGVEGIIVAADGALLLTDERKLGR